MGFKGGKPINGFHSGSGGSSSAGLGIGISFLVVLVVAGAAAAVWFVRKRQFGTKPPGAIAFENPSYIRETNPDSAHVSSTYIIIITAIIIVGHLIY